jgi:hypothetical protein
MWKELLVPSSLSRPRLTVRLPVVLLVTLALVSSWPNPASAASGRLSGVVRDNSGAAQSGARVILVAADGREAGSDSTGSGGRFSVDVAPGRYDVAVVTQEPVQRITRVRAVDVAADSVLDVVVLPPFVTMSGTVRDRSGAPVGGGGRVLLGDQNRIDASAHIDQQGRYSLRTRPGTYPLSITVQPDNGSSYLYAGIKAFTLTDDRVQDLTFAVTLLTVEAVDDQQRPVELAGVGAHSPQDCDKECPAGFELIPGAGEATGVWRSFRSGSTVLTLPGDIDVTAAPKDPGLAPAGRRVNAPWASPLRVVTPDAPAPTPPPATVAWSGVVRHNGHPVSEVTLTVEDPGGDHAESDGVGRFELQVVPGHHNLRLSAFIGSAYADDSGGPPPALHLEVADFEITSARTMDINIPTEPFAVTVLSPGGHPMGQVPANGTSRTSSLDIFPGGRATGSVGNYVPTDADGKATFEMFPSSPPATVDVWEDGLFGSAAVAPSDRSVTVRLHETETANLSGTVRDLGGPLPLANHPWLSFGGQAKEPTDEFEGSFIDAAGRYSLDAVPGRQTLTISDLPENEYYGHEDSNVATPTLPQLWTITTEVDLSTSRTLDLTVPDAAPAHFRTVNSDGVPFAARFGISSEHTLDLASGITGHAWAETGGRSPDGRFEHMLFGAATATGAVGGWDAPTMPFSLRAAPGDNLVLAFASRYTGGAVMPPAPTTPPPTTTTTTPPPTAPPTAQPDPAAGTASNPEKSGYWALASDGTVYNFGDAPRLGEGTAGAVDLEPTSTAKGYWTLHKDGRVQAFGDAAKLGDVDLGTLAKGELPASLSATPSGRGYWIFTNRGRVIPFGDAPFLGDVSDVNLNGPVLGSVANPTGKGYYMVASDGGIFTFGDAAFLGSMGGTKLNAPVQSLVPGSDGKGYWLVASDGGIFAFDAPFKGSLGNVKLNKPVVGMVRYGDGYLMVGADGGIFTFSSLPFSGSLGDKPPSSPVVAVAALPA